MPRGERLPVARMTPAQRAMFVAAVNHRRRGNDEPVNVEQAAAGSLTLTSERTEETLAPAAGSAPGAVARTEARRYPVLRLDLHFALGAEQSEPVSLTVAPPP